MEQNKNEYSLSIRFASDGFSLSVLDGAGRVLLRRMASAPLFQMPKRELAGFLEKEMDADVADYGRVVLVVETDDYEFVPAALFRPTGVDDYFYFRHGRDGRSLVLFNRVSQWEGVNVFALPAALHEVLAGLFPDVMPRHQVSAFLAEQVKKTMQRVSVLVRPECLDVAVVKEGRLQLVNSFRYRTVEDAVYFVLNCFEQFGLGAEKAEVALYQREKNADLRNALAMYVDNVLICK